MTFHTELVQSEGSRPRARNTRACLIGALAAHELARPGYTARVLGATSQAIYLESCEGDILWLSPSDSLPHRRAILASFEDLDWRAGATCSSENGCLCAVGHARVEWRGVPVWRAREFEGAGFKRPTARQAFSIAFEALGRDHAQRGLATLWAGDRGGMPGEAVGSSWLGRALGPAVQAADASRTADTAKLLRAADLLVGLGEGLTPSGDDFLGGLLFIQSQTDRRQEPPKLDWNAIDAWLDDARTRTTAISHAVVADLAHGHGPEPLHRLLSALAEGASPDDVAIHARAVAHIGQTSGWDLLAGVAAGLGLSPVSGGFGSPA